MHSFGTFLEHITNFGTLLISLASVYNSDSSNHVHRKAFFNTISNIFACISPLTKKVGAIMIQNEDINALQTTGTMNHTLSDIMSV